MISGSDGSLVVPDFDLSKPKKHKIQNNILVED